MDKSRSKIWYALTVGIARPQAILAIKGFKDEMAGDLTLGPT